MTSAPPVQSALRSARLRARLARGVEHVLASGAAASVVLAAAALSGVSTTSPGALLSAGLCGALALATLAFERRESALEFARRMDVRVGADGALATAFECEADRDASAIARLHAQRTAARFSAAALRRAVPSPSPAFVAALLAGAALVALARQKAPAEGAEGARDLASTGSVAAGSRSHPSDKEWRNSAARESRGAPESHERSAAAGGGAQVTSKGVERMQVPGTASSGAGQESSSEPASVSSATAGSPAGSQRAEGVNGASGAGAGRGSDTRTLTATSGESTMSGPPPEPGMPTTATSGTPASSTPAAAPSGRWWPRRHDAVVARYVERTRAAQSAEAAPSAGAAPR